MGPEPRYHPVKDCNGPPRVPAGHRTQHPRIRPERRGGPQRQFLSKDHGAVSVGYTAPISHNGACLLIRARREKPSAPG